MLILLFDVFGVGQGGFAMRALQELDATALRWAAAKNVSYELRSENKVVARLRWDDTLGRTVAEAAEGEWAFTSAARAVIMEPLV